MKPWLLTFYKLLLYLLSPILLMHTIRQSIKRKGGRQFITQRMGWFQTREPACSSIWMHAASVGEARTLIPLLTPLQNNFPHCKFTLTCNTPEAYQILTKLSGNSISLRYCTIDFPGATDKLFKSIQPSIVILVETELWPCLLATAGAHAIPVVVINGRLSRKTLNTGSFIRQLYRDSVRHICCVLARSTADAKGFKQLGVPHSRIKTLGNLKNAYRGNADLKVLPELAGKRYILAASTHAPEEQLLASISRQIDSSVLLVIAPRHPQRSEELQQQLTNEGFSYAVRSLGHPITPTTRIYLADTTGELDRLFTEAEVVFMGGSFSQTGGHNILEPAAWARPIICGPNLWNFSEERALLSEKQALLIIDEKHQLHDAIDTLLTTPELRLQMGQAALAAVSALATSTLELYVSEISKCIPLQRTSP
ncbi:hypothetical protein AB833_14125 [Chromatiales bacterium (ex Bugula neritina AB1)]|nr:hypothetical protein AB833_14125 [Chromatiales bacterium (ex Bugula neritina AB1)]